VQKKTENKYTKLHTDESWGPVWKKKVTKILLFSVSLGGVRLMASSA
jgi:hypothetical protein